MKVLIVDPDWHFFFQTRDILESCGHCVVQEQAPQAALERAEHWQPDLILVSAELPETAEGDLLQSLAELRPRPAILLTAGLDRFDKAWRAWQHGGDDVLFKPVLHPSELHVAIITARENALCPPRRRTAPEPVARSA